MNMLRTVAANTYGTMFEDLMTDRSFRKAYARIYGEDELNAFDIRNKEHRQRKEVIKRRRDEKEIPSPGARKLIGSIRKSGFGFVAYAGAPVEVTRERYSESGIEIDGVYSSSGQDRNLPETFYEMIKVMERDGLEPIAYLSHVPCHVLAAARSWGGGLLSKPRLEHQTMIYQFSWDEFDPQKIVKFLGSLKNE
jgi:hypothetical protein